MKRKSFALATIGLTAGFVVAAGSGVAIGSGIRTVNESGVISSCVKADNGALRVASSTADCKKSELPLTWQQQASSGAAAVTYVEETFRATANGESRTIAAELACPTGTKAVNGFALPGGTGFYSLGSFIPKADGSAITFNWGPDSYNSGESFLTVRAVCIG